MTSRRALLHGINIHAKFWENQSKKIKMRTHTHTHTQDDDLVNLQLFPDRRKADQNITPANLIYTHIHMRLTVMYLHTSWLSSWLYKLLGNCSLLKCVQAFREGACDCKRALA
jgi:hypothetical protein